jgi:hypothetical protein
MWGYPAHYYRQHAPAQGLIRRCADELAQDLTQGVPISQSVADGLLGPLGPADIAYVVSGLPHAPKGYPATGDWRGRLADALATAAGYPAAYAAGRYPAA